MNIAMAHCFKVKSPFQHLVSSPPTNIWVKGDLEGWNDAVIMLKPLEILHMLCWCLNLDQIWDMLSIKSEYLDGKGLDCCYHIQSFTKHSVIREGQVILPYGLCILNCSEFHHMLHESHVRKVHNMAETAEVQWVPTFNSRSYTNSRMLVFFSWPGWEQAVDMEAFNHLAGCRVCWCIIKCCDVQLR